MSISKLFDLASPMLAQICARRKSIPKAKLEMQRADGNGEPVKYLARPVGRATDPRSTFALLLKQQYASFEHFMLRLNLDPRPSCPEFALA